MTNGKTRVVQPCEERTFKKQWFLKLVTKAEENYPEIFIEKAPLSIVEQLTDVSSA